MVIFTLNGMVFILIGLQLPTILDTLSASRTFGELASWAVVVSLTVILVRLVWVFPGTWLPRMLSPAIRARERAPVTRNVLIVGWAGMRGVVSLAAALAIPNTLPDKVTPFPDRDLLIFLTFSVILATLVGQGLTLPLLIRALGLQSLQEGDQEEFEARREILNAALSRLESMRKEDTGRFADVYDDVAQHYRTRLSTLTDEGADEHGTTAQHTRRYDEVSRELVGLER